MSIPYGHIRIYIRGRNHYCLVSMQIHFGVHPTTTICRYGTIYSRHVIYESESISFDHIHHGWIVLTDTTIGTTPVPPFGRQEKYWVSTIIVIDTIIGNCDCRNMYYSISVATSSSCNDSRYYPTWITPFYGIIVARNYLA